MKRILVIFACAAALSGVATGQSAPNAADLLARVDANEVYNTITYKGKMIIEYQGRRYVKEMQAWAKGKNDSFVEFFNPEDRGPKYLKKGSRLYVYSPDSEQVMLISGHLLKESMMGSDLSYEDTIENERLSARYTPVLAGTEVLGDLKAWVLDLTARNRTESYPRRKLWIDAVTGDVLRYELYALSGAKLKEYNLVRAETIDGRRFPVESEMRDLLRKDSRTVFVMDQVVLDVPIADSVFSMRNLER